MSTIIEKNTNGLRDLIDIVSSLPTAKKIQGSKTITPSDVEQTIIPDSGYDAIGSITVAAIPEQYEDITTPLVDLNVLNGGDAATTMAASVSNTETLIAEETNLIGQIDAALDELGAGSGTNNGGDNSGSNEVPTFVLQEKTVTPKSSSQTVTPDSGYNGLSKVTVTGDSNLVAANIKNGVSIFGVAGSMNAGATVQRKSGSVSLTDSDKTVACGFQPDALFFTLNETYTYDDTTFQCCAGVLFNELQSGNEFDCAFYSGDFAYVYEIWGSRTASGFTAGYQSQRVSDNWTSAASKSFNYVAIKYT